LRRFTRPEGEAAAGGDPEEGAKLVEEGAVEAPPPSVGAKLVS